MDTLNQHQQRACHHTLQTGHFGYAALEQCRQRQLPNHVSCVNQLQSDWLSQMPLAWPSGSEVHKMYLPHAVLYPCPFNMQLQ